jgi:ribosomal protein L40E/uncharacterized membrane protein
MNRNIEEEIENLMNEIDRNHESKRNTLRTIGPLVLAIGVLFMIIGFVDFFSSMGMQFGGPNLFWCFFVGMPLLFVGVVMTSAGYAGTVARYQAAEIAPVGKDVINYMATETKDSIGSLVRSIHDGSNEQESLVKCRKCNEENEMDAIYCNHCGEKLNIKTECKQCGAINEGDSKFCNKCGEIIESTILN